MNRISNVVLCSLAFLAATLATLPLASGQENTASQQVGRIKLDNVPLADALRIVAQRTGRNYILDPGLCNPRFGPDGKPGQQPSVSVDWENLSAEEALGRLLKGSGLVMVTNPATSILRITYTNHAIPVLPPMMTGAGTNPVLSSVVLEDVPLDEAIRMLAAQAQLQIALDASAPTPSTHAPGLMTIEPNVSVHWKNVTARQALMALLDNYDLLLVEDPDTKAFRIQAKTQTQAGNAQRRSP
jgi:hypothetical protein